MTARFAAATSFPALLAATRRAAEGLRTRPPVARFLVDREPECLALQRRLRLPVCDGDAWRPGDAHRYLIHDPKRRLITAVPFADRVVHHALCHAVESDFERYAIAHSYACRVGKGQFAAISRLQRLCRGAAWALKLDIANYLASIPHDALLDLVRQRVRDRDLCDLFERIVRAPQLSSSPGRGIPIGTLTSQHLANLYLGRLDHHVTSQLGLGSYVRFMDDVVVLGDREPLRLLLKVLRSWVGDSLGLSLREERCRVAPVRDGIPFLGARVYPSLVRVRPTTWRRLRRGTERDERAFALGVISEVELAAAATSRFAHFAHFDSMRLRSNWLARRGRGEAEGDHHRREPRDPGRLLELQPAEHAGGEPQPRRAVEPQRQRGLSRSELDAGMPDGRKSGPGAPWPDDGGSRIAALRPGIDQVPFQRPDGLRRGTEPQRPGGDEGEVDLVAAGSALSGGG